MSDSRAQYPLRDPVRELLTDPGRVTKRDLWVALTPDERARAITRSIRTPMKGQEHLLNRVKKVFRWRPQVLKERIHELAPQLDRSGAFDGVEAPLLFSLWAESGLWEIFHSVWQECGAEESPHTVSTGERIHFANIEPLIKRGLKIDTNLAIIFLLDFVLFCPPWKNILHSWLASVDDVALYGITTRPETEAGTDADLAHIPNDPKGSHSDRGSADIELWEQRLTGLEAEFDSLASQMDEVARQLRELRVPPPPEFARRIDALVSEYNTFRAAVLDDAQYRNETADSSVDPTSLTLIRALLDSWRSQSDANTIRKVTAEQARLVLRQIALLASPHVAVDVALQACRNEASELLNSIMDDRSEQDSIITALSSGQHPFALLVARVSGDELSVEDDTVLDAWLRERFGTALAIAVLSGRISFQDAEPTEDDSLTPISSSVSEVAEADVIEAVQSSRSELDGILVIAQESPGGVVVDTYAGAPRESGQDPVVMSQPSVSTSVPVSSTDTHAGTSPTNEAVQGPAATENLLIGSPALGDEANGQSARLGLPSGGLWELLGIGNTAIAYHIARVQEEASIPPRVLKALVLGREIRTGFGEIAQALREPFEWIGNDYLSCDSGGQRAIHLLIAAAAIRPALIAPVTGGAAVLRQLHLEGDLYRFVQTVASYGERLNGLDPAALGGALSLAQWQEKENQLRSDVENYLQQAGLRTILYPRATDVLRIWAREDGFIRKLLTPILNGDTGTLLDTVERIQTVDFEREVERTDKTLRGGRRDPIQARALDSLRNIYKEATHFIWRWQELQGLKPKSDHYQQAVIQELRHEFESIYPKVEAELREIFLSGATESTAGSGLLQRAVSDLKDVVINGTDLGAGEPSPVHLLNSVLLRTTLPLNNGLEPIGSAFQVEEALRNLLVDEPGWSIALERRMADRDFDGGRRIVDFLRDVQDDAAAALVDRWNREVTSGLHSLGHDLSETRRQLEEHVSKGLVREGDRSTYDATLVGVERRIAEVRRPDGRVDTSLPPDRYRFYDEHRRLKEIREAIDELKRDRTNNTLSRLENSGLDIETVTRIRVVLDRGDLLTAEEYIDLAESQQLPSDIDEERDEFFEFFPNSARKIERYLEEFAPLVVVEHIRERLPIPGLQIERLDANQARQAAELMAEWYDLKRKRAFHPQAVIKLLTGLGFRPVEAVASNSSHVVEMDVRAQAIADRTEIPVEFFGSRAGGKYRLVGIWDRRSEEEISGIVGDSHTEAATIVCFFGRLTEQQRSSFGEICRRLRKTFIVIDELLLLFLCGEPGSRLPVLFRCTLPFTHLDPYITTGSLVPPEMFFGRERERDQIIDPNGPSVLYGGRQLGKTALLRHVKRMYHNPDKGWVVRWLDLRAEGIGYYRGTEEIWPILVRELIRNNVLSTRTPPTTGPDRIIDLIKEWLGAKQGRRIVLLLDEADRFLEWDSKDEFRQTALLKKLMDQTGRAFKVVFAGLHNVYRTFNDPNHPIGHFGNPIQIGPLIDNGEARSARALIADPFRLVGYRFESLDLISRILAETNYYPSLLQLYGANLLKHLGERQARTGRHSTPPILITHEDVEDASRSRDLREAIHQRFALTLQLDPRYEVIAYALAHAIVEHNLSLEEGASAEWIRKDALYWWPEGFEGTSGPELRVLLDEMVGLGVLRSAGGSYTFRNANVLLLMGTEEEIRSAVLRDRPAPPVYEAATFRDIVRTPEVRMSPLTAQQLGVLRQASNDICLLIGSEANDLSSVPEFLTRFFGQEFVRLAEGISSHRDFTRWLTDLRLSQARHGTTLVLVNSDVPWARNWIEVAGEWLSKRKSRDLTLKVVFVADPKAALRLSDFSVDEINSLNVRILELTPWHDSAVNQWLDANNVTSSPIARHRISEVTGNRPLLLYRYVEKFNRTFTWEQPADELEQELRDGAVREETLSALGLDGSSAVSSNIFATMAALGEPTSARDLVVLLDTEVSVTDVESALEWAEHLQIVRRIAADTWILDPFVRRLISEVPS